MDGTSASPAPQPSRKGLSPTGELVIQNGRLKGTRRALGIPLTFIGNAPSSDVRLNVDGVSALHCLIVHGPGGFVLRDLDSDTGTVLNGERINTSPLKNGDQLTVGPFQFRVRLPRLGSTGQAVPTRQKPLPTAVAGSQEALRIQVAAVVAQQTALTEEEARLQQRRATLEQQEAQVAAHLDEKRRRLVELHSQVQAARSALKRDKEAYEQHVEKVTGDLSLAERDMLERRQQAETERRRAALLQRRLRDRFRRHLRAERKATRERERQLEGTTRDFEKKVERLHKEKAALADAWLRFNSELEIKRRQLQEEWDKLSQGQKEWRQHQRQAETHLGAWTKQLEQREGAATSAQKAYERDRAHWQSVRVTLEKEAAGLDNRARSQRRKLQEHQQELAQLEGRLQALRSQEQAGAAVPELQLATGVSVPAEAAPVAAVPAPTSVFAAPPLLLTYFRDSVVPLPEAAAPSPETVAPPEHQLLEQLLDELSDQRLQLVEEWQLLVEARGTWVKEQSAAATELRFLASRLQEQAHAFLTREERLRAEADQLRRRYQELSHLRQHLVGWQTRLQGREVSWESERDRTTADLRGREELVERHLHALVTVRESWVERRRQELDQVEAERAACEQVRQQYAALLDEKRRREQQLEDERAELTSRQLALEQYRQQHLKRLGDPAAAERKIERLRRRMLTEQAQAIRTIKRERAAAQAELTRLDRIAADQHRRSQELHADRANLSEQLAAWEQQKTELATAHERIKQEAVSLRLERDRMAQEAAGLRNEIEQMARQLLDEPEAPTLFLEQAA
jgi:pSer/pThr/pTyr-binding forkhead associated (FHA) protein